MFSGKIFIKDLILLFMDKFIYLVILFTLPWKFYGSLCRVLECFGKYFMIFGVLQLWYAIYDWKWLVSLIKSHKIIGAYAGALLW